MARERKERHNIGSLTQRTPRTKAGMKGPKKEPARREHPKEQLVLLSLNYHPLFGILQLQISIKFYRAYTRYKSACAHKALAWFYVADKSKFSKIPADIVLYRADVVFFDQYLSVFLQKLSSSYTGLLNEKPQHNIINKFRERTICPKNSRNYSKIL